jgi:MFS family permease
MGLTTLVDVVAEVPAFLGMTWLLERVSPGVLIHLSLLGYVLRLGMYATLSKWKYPQLVMFVQLLHGITYAWGWGAGTIISRRLSTPATQATMQGMYQAAYLAVGQGAGSVVGGVLAKKFGLPSAFTISSGVMAGGWVLYLVGTILVQVFKCDGCEEVASRFDLRKEARAEAAAAAAGGGDGAPAVAKK